MVIVIPLSPTPAQEDVLHGSHRARDCNAIRPGISWLEPIDLSTHGCYEVDASPLGIWPVM
jgi:hypothetical protein